MGRIMRGRSEGGRGGVRREGKREKEGMGRTDPARSAVEENRKGKGQSDLNDGRERSLDAQFPLRHPRFHNPHDGRRRLRHREYQSRPQHDLDKAFEDISRALGVEGRETVRGAAGGEKFAVRREREGEEGQREREAERVKDGLGDDDAEGAVDEG